MSQPGIPSQQATINREMLRLAEDVMERNQWHTNASM